MATPAAVTSAIELTLPTVAGQPTPPLRIALDLTRFGLVT
jgi:hypothetical protein